MVSTSMGGHLVPTPEGCPAPGRGPTRHANDINHPLRPTAEAYLRLQASTAITLPNNGTLDLPKKAPPVLYKRTLGQSGACSTSRLGCSILL